jgi:copper(I)-binding protein
MKFFLMMAAFLLIAATAQSADKTAYTFKDAFVRATPMKMSAGYVVIANPAAQPDKLLGATADWAGRIELHEIVENKGIVEMRRVAQMKLPAKGALSLRPNGFHLMLFDLKAPLKAGGRVSLTLRFARAGDVPVTFRVMPVSYKGE